ncbi:hypothetical protein [Cupriavidus necator]|uniref:hypothetical protein n=1 Tax=Cupriavidus necator TaxID=106590 RepID=UPI0012D327D5|nr:hypothetical protein [Cupriavidus necator]
MSSGMTIESTGWDDPLPSHDPATHREPAAAAAAASQATAATPSHDPWASDPNWESEAVAANAQSPADNAGGAAAAAPASPGGSEAEKAKKKRTANVLIAGVAVALVGVVGSGLAIKMSRSNQAAEEYVPEPVVKAQPASQSPRQPAPAAPIIAQQAAPQPDIQPAADTMVVAKSDLSPAPASAIAPGPAPAAAQPAVVASPSTDASGLSDLKARDSALEAANAELKGKITALTERVAALESRGQAAPTSTDQSTRKQTAAHAYKAKQQTKLAYEADVVRGKPGGTGAAKAEAEHPSSWSGYRTVATYPATGKAEKAWVTNGKGLVVVTVGSEIDGVKVSRLAGTTVYLADGGKISVK